MEGRRGGGTWRLGRERGSEGEKGEREGEGQHLKRKRREKQQWNLEKRANDGAGGLPVFTAAGAALRREGMREGEGHRGDGTENGAERGKERKKERKKEAQ